MTTPIKQIKFSFQLDQPGTAKAAISFDETETEFALTNVCNPLGDMYAAMVSLLANPQHLWGNENKVAFVWYCEDESYNWTLQLENENKLHIRLTQTCEFFGDDEIEIADHECNYLDFVYCVVHDMDDRVKKHGLLNYQQQWQSNEFPLTSFLFLKKYLIDNERWEMPQEISGCILNREMQILMA